MSSDASAPFLFSIPFNKGSMTLDEFIVNAPASLLAFKSSTLKHAETDPSFHLDRTEIDWWREVAAYNEYIEFEEIFQKE